MNIPIGLIGTPDEDDALELMTGISPDEALQFVRADGGGYPDNNPKTAMGAKKPDLSVIPPSALLHLATAMMNGAEKYGPFNWRDQPISARPYLAAAMRHLLAFLDGEDFSADTVENGVPVHHLAHVQACCAIVLDAMECGTLIDNRPKVFGPAGQMIEVYNKTKQFERPATHH